MNILKLLNDKQWRKQNIRYWIQDPFWGGLSYLGYHVCRYLPIQTNAKLGAGFGEWLGKYYFKTKDAQVKHNLSVLRPDLTESERAVIAIKMWRNFGQILTEFSLLDKLSNDRQACIVNEHYVLQAVETAKPIILVFAHTGNWEVRADYLISLGLKPLFLTNPKRNRFITRIALKARKGMFSEDNLLQAGPKAMYAMCEHLAKGRGHTLWMAMDEFRNGQVQAPCLARPIALRGTNLDYAVRLAQRYQATILPIWNKRVGFGQFSITVGEPITVAQNDSSVQETVKKLDSLLEQWVMANIEQWYDRLFLLRL